MSDYLQPGEYDPVRRPEDSDYDRAIAALKTASLRGDLEPHGIGVDKISGDIYIEDQNGAEWMLRPDGRLILITT
jgi:hypothetical protein